jgi:hypothetical protein
MHEINTVAETITAAADPEANIIFGATINPDLEGEIIVTVVATGFDDSYFATRDVKTAELLRRTSTGPGEEKIDDAAIADIDMELKDETPAADFHSDDTPNIWALPDEDSPASAEQTEDELERPSFLRRLRGRRQADGDDYTDDVVKPDDSGGKGPAYPFGAPDDNDSPSTDMDNDSDDSGDEGEQPENKDGQDEKKPAKPSKK